MRVTLMITVIWNVIPCSLVEIHHHFREACRLHHQSCPDDAGSKFLQNISTLVPATQLHGITFLKACS